MIESLINVFKTWLDAMLTVAGLWQLVIVVISTLVAWEVRRRWQQYILIRIGNEEKRGLKRFALRGSTKIVFPLAMLFMILIGSSIIGQYALNTSLLDILIPLLLSLAAVRIAVYSLRRAFTPSAALRAWEGIIGSAVWVVVAMHLLGWLPEIVAALDGLAIEFGATRISMLTIIQLILATAAFIVLASWLSRFIEQKANRSEYISASMQVGLIKISRLLLYTVAVLIALKSVGIDLTALAVFGGALGVGLGFGLQRIASNFISGFILLFDRSIKPGDVISIGTRFGWVVALHARYIVVRDREGVETLIPNENLITSEVTNWSYTDRHVRIKIPVQISYNDDPKIAMQLIVDASKANKRVLTKPEPQIRLTEFGDNGINLELRVWLSDPEQGVASVKSDIYLAIWDKFKEQGITIPFPQRDVRVAQV